MKTLSITAARLTNQQISQTHFKKPAQLLHHMGAMQAQDYAGAKWALGLRIIGLTDEMVDDALAKGDILRTHVMRPTWHFVAPEDIGWMLQLTAPRINQACAYNNKRMGLDTPLYNKCNKLLEKELEGKELDRLAIAALLEKKGIATDELRLVHILMRAEIDGVICSGGRVGKQFTYALLEERVPKKKAMQPAAPLAELAKRYFISHGPATLQDYTWWSGLTVTDAKKGLEMAKEGLVSETINGQTYWMGEEHSTVKHSPKVLLLPAFDEYTVAYKDRSDILPAEHAAAAKNGVSNPVIIIDGKIAGTWQRKLLKNKVEVTTHLFIPLNKTRAKELDGAIRTYTQFLLGK